MWLKPVIEVTADPTKKQIFLSLFPSSSLEGSIILAIGGRGVRNITTENLFVNDYTALKTECRFL
jgi:hypothetical protein